MSKAALTQATRTMAHELKRQGTYAVAVHPGTTDTGLSKPFQRNVKPEKLFPVDFTVNQILDIVDHLDADHSGGLYDWAGKAIPF
jgi:NAD(P)-dependent dehydrogenase (short-subunit alcohol dehydrogenase family)